MRVRGFLLLSIIALGLAGLAFAGSSEKKAEAKTVTLEGTLVDTKCFSMDAANKGDKHGEMEACATMCAKMGVPVALLTEKGQVYVLLAPSPAFKDHMSKTAKVTGVKAFDGKSIRPEKLEVKGDDGKWIAVDTQEMM